MTEEEELRFWIKNAIHAQQVFTREGDRVLAKRYADKAYALRQQLKKITGKTS